MSDHRSFLITGGNQGLGLEIATHFGGASLSRSTGHDIITNRKSIAQISLDFDVFVNNAYDGEFGQSQTAYGQVQLLTEVAMAWRDSGKSGHIINIGGVGSEDLSEPFPGWESYNANKAALKHQSQQWTQAFRHNQVLFRTSLITVDRLDTPVGRTRPTWTGNGTSASDIISMIKLCINSKSNTCIGEVVSWINLDHDQTPRS
jgi:NAD(P)-dependent dehydrogenase (short-subunit alcohol dehydrogenase family)